MQEFLIHGGQPLLFHTGKFHHLGDDHSPLLWDDSVDGPGGVTFVAGSITGSS